MGEKLVLMDSVATTYPELRGILDALASVLAPGQVMRKQAWEETEQAKLSCKRSRGRYLELACLESAIQETVDDYHSCAGAVGKEGNAAASVLQAEGLWCNSKIYESLYSSLTEAVASQKLRMPEFEEGVVLRSSLPHNSDQKVATFLGLAPEHVQTSGSRNLARQVIPELEHRLELKVTSLLEIIARRDGDDCSDEYAGREFVGSLFARRLMAIDRSREDEAALMAQCASSFSQCLSSLVQLLSILGELIADHKHGAVRKSLEAQARYLQAHCSTLLLKLDTLEHQIKYKTYTSQTVPALCAVAGHIQGRRKDLEDKLSQVQCQLKAYRDGGQELKQMSERYRTVKESLADAKYALEQMESLALQEF